MRAKHWFFFFSQYVIQGLDDEYQEEGTLLGQYTYQEDGEALQMFPVMVTEKAFQALFLWGLV